MNQVFDSLFEEISDTQDTDLELKTHFFPRVVKEFKHYFNLRNKTEDLNLLIHFSSCPEKLRNKLLKEKFHSSTINAAFLLESYGGNVEALRVLKQHGANIRVSHNLALLRAAGRGDNSIIKELISYGIGSVKGELNGATFRAASSEKTDTMMLLFENGGFFGDKEIEQLKTINIDPVKKGHSVLAAQLINMSKNPIPLSSLDEYCGHAGKKIRKSDAFSKDVIWSKQNFVQSCLHSAHIASALCLNDFKALKGVFVQLILNDIDKVENTKGISWKKYRNNLENSLVGIEDIKDLIEEFSECLVIPILSRDFCILEEEDLLRNIKNMKRAAIFTLIEGKASIDFTGLNKSWHKAGNQIPDYLRPFKQNGKWIPFFEGEIDLGNEFSIVSLNSAEDLKREGAYLDHCVGIGSYARACRDGIAHVLSIRLRDEPHATLEIVTDNGRGDIMLDGKGKIWRTIQFRGASNCLPSRGANRALEKFCNLTIDSRIPITSIHGEIAENTPHDNELTPLEHITGFLSADSDKVFKECIKHYSERVRVQKNKKKYIPLITKMSIEELREIVVNNFLKMRALHPDGE